MAMLGIVLNPSQFAELHSLIRNLLAWGIHCLFCNVGLAGLGLPGMATPGFGVCMPDPLTKKKRELYAGNLLQGASSISCVVLGYQLRISDQLVGKRACHTVKL